MSDLIGSLNTLFVRHQWTAETEHAQQDAPGKQDANEAVVENEARPSEREESIYWAWPYTGCW